MFLVGKLICQHSITISYHKKIKQLMAMTKTPNEKKVEGLNIVEGTFSIMG